MFYQLRFPSTESCHQSIQIKASYRAGLYTANESCLLRMTTNLLAFHADAAIISNVRELLIWFLVSFRSETQRQRNRLLV